MTSEMTVFDVDNNIWTSPKSYRLFDRMTSIGDVALTMMRSQPSERICQISDTENTKLTYGEACERAIQIAEYLKNLGLTDEDVIGFIVPHTSYLMPVILGCWLNCTRIYMLNFNLGKDAIRKLLNINKPKFIFCDGLMYESLKDLPFEFYTICNHLEGVKNVEEIFKKTQVSSFFKPIQLKYGGEQTMAIFCSSGTTGEPKCVPFTNSRLLYNASGKTGSDILYSITDPAWATMLLPLLFNMLFGSKRIIATQTPTNEYLIEMIKKYQITYLFLPPYRIMELASKPNFNQTNLPSLQTIFTTGSPCSIAKLKLLRESLPKMNIMNVYGCTESGPIAMDINSVKMGVLGKLCFDIQLKIVDSLTKKSLKHNENGEIYARSMLSKWCGYIGTEKVNYENFDDEGWFNTGDVGYMDNENILHLVDRYKDILKYKSQQISLIEIEDVINELKEVKDVCVFGVVDEEFSDLAAAAIVKLENCELSETEVMNYVAKRLVFKHKCLNYGVFFVEKIFRNTNGKLLRNKMRDFCLEKLTEEKE